MSLKKRSGLFILFLVIVAIPLYSTSYTVSSLDSHISQYNINLDVNPDDFVFTNTITIDEDSDFINFGFPGSGVEEDPYIISNLYIIGNVQDPAITIKNVNSHFVITDCYIIGGEFNIYIEFIANGIATITNNSCLLGAHAGIYIYATSRHNITNNTIAYASGPGISSWACDEMNIINNTCAFNSEGIRSWFSNRFKIESNRCLNNGNRGIDIHVFPFDEPVIGTVCRNICLESYVGIDVTNDDGQMLNVSENILMRNSYAGIILFSETIHVFNNTIQYNRDGIVTSYLENSDIFNNLIMNNTEFGIRILSSSRDFENLRIFHNFFDGNGDANHSQVYCDRGILETQWFEETLNEGNIWTDWNGTGSYYFETSEEVTYDTYDPHPLLANDTDSDGLYDWWENYYSLDVFSNDSFLDVDSDLLTNSEEYSLGTNPNLFDTDGDNITDGYENDTLLTDPLNFDSDDDQIPDGIELFIVSSPILFDSDLDSDNDNTTNLIELIYLTDLHSNDTDQDDLIDGEEIYIYQTHPLLEDSDGDLLTDGEEVHVYGTYPRSSDSDRDQLTDYEEVHIYETNPMMFDSDQDGLSDGAEILEYLTDPLDWDSDDDGWSDGWEINNGFNPLVNERLVDEDQDGLSDYDEYNLGTDPLNPDSDGDGLTDFEEVTLSTNPLSSDSDNDSLPDFWEVHNGLNPLQNDAQEDPDGDRQNNLREYILGRDPHTWDNWALLCGGYLLPIWLILVASLTYISMISYKQILRRRRGFLSVKDMKEAETVGFLKGNEYYLAIATGFSTREQWVSSIASGFQTEDEWIQALRGGYIDVVTKNLVEELGFESISDLQEKLTSLLRELRHRKNNILSQLIEFEPLDPKNSPRATKIQNTLRENYNECIILIEELNRFSKISSGNHKIDKGVKSELESSESLLEKARRTFSQLN